MDWIKVREKTNLALKKRRWPVHESLPLLDLSLTKRRSPKECASRAITLHSAVAAVYGFPKEKAKQWLEFQACESSLTAYERTFLESSEEFDLLLQNQPQCLYVFAWALGKIDSIDALGKCPDNLVECFPDLRSNEKADEWMASPKLRSDLEIAELVDLLYEAHSIATDDYLNGKATQRARMPIMLRERRRAAEWILAADDWDNMPLDT